MRAGILRMAVVFLAVVAAEVLFHWYAGRGASPFSAKLQYTYLHRDPDNHKAYVAGCIDLIIPAVIFGIGIGTIGAAWPSPSIVAAVIFSALCLTVLIPLYAAFFQAGGAHWWSPSDSVPLVQRDYAVAFIKGLATVGIVTYASMILTRYFRGIGD